MAAPIPASKTAVKDELLNKRIEAEHVLIGCAMLRGDDLRQSCGWLRPDAFYEERAGKLWKRFLDGEEIINVAAELGSDLYFEIIGWMTAIHSSYAQGEESAKQIARYAYLDNNKADMGQLALAMYQGDFEGFTGTLKRMADRTPEASATIRTAIDVGEHFLALLEADNHTIDTRMIGLDRATGGLERQNLTVIAAPPSTGKSALALQLARNIACTHSVLFASLEMPETDLWARMACGDAGVSWLDIRRKLTTTDKLERVAEVTMELIERYDTRLMIHDKPSATTDLWQMVAAKRPDVLIVDHIRFCKDEGEKETKRLGVITQRLREIGKQFDCAVVALAQLNREHDKRSDARPVLSDLRDSGEIEENADNVWMLYVDSDGKNKLVDQSKIAMELWARKARNGQRDVLVNLIYNRLRQWIRSNGDPEEA